MKPIDARTKSFQKDFLLYYIPEYKKLEGSGAGAGVRSKFKEVMRNFIKTKGNLLSSIYNPD